VKSREPRSNAAPVSGPPLAAGEVLAVADDQGRLMVTIDGAVVTASPIGRAAFGALVDELLRRRRQPIALLLIEADGTRYTDTLHPEPQVPERLHASPTTASTDQAAAPPVSTHAAQTLPATRAGGFIPGEAVAIAQITMHQSADTDGRIPMLDEPIPDGVEVALIGRISGTVLLLPQPQ
jgi:hypothetical protein